MGGQRVELDVRVRRFLCTHSACSRRTFGERWPWLASHERCTDPLLSAQRAVATAMSAEGGARLLTRLAMPGSADTLLRRVRAAPLPTTRTRRVLSVDDWAFRKGARYGSILVDLDAHRPVDLLSDRSAQTLAAWLRRHPGVETVVRDRSSEYALGARLGAPGARQVVDRWHLLANVREMLQRYLTAIHARLRALPAIPSATTDGNKRERAF